MGVQRFEDLVAWQIARELTRAVYAATRTGELSRDRGLATQMQRAAVSVMSNIAEGFERNRPEEFHQALSTAKASCAEVRSLLIVASDAGLLGDGPFREMSELASRVGSLVGALRSAVARQAATTVTGTARTRPTGRSTQHAARRTEH